MTEPRALRFARAFLRPWGVFCSAFCFAVTINEIRVHNWGGAGLFVFLSWFMLRESLKRHPWEQQ